MNSKYRLGVNIDHVATLRNARGGKYPSVLLAAKKAISSGADSITVHLREDERHIKPEDVISLKNKLTKPLNLEMALTDKMLSFAIKIKPKYVCFVPEKRKELTTEGGLNLFYNESFLTKAINKLKKNSIEVSLFIDPQIINVKQALKLKVNNIELHTGTYCNFLINKKKDKAKKEFNKIRASAIFANKKNLGVHCGHGLDYVSTKKIKKIVEISEYNIGHFIISESLFLGFESVVNKFVKIIKK
jgi:pyridoxine 5-phosphate synthase